MTYIFKQRLSNRPNYESPNDDSPAGGRCPEIWELTDGSIAVIGREITSLASKPKEVLLHDYEKIVQIPRSVLDSAIARLK